MPDREKVINELQELHGSKETMELISDAITMLKEQETANIYKCPNCGTWVSAENVVRCKDCKHWLPMNRFDPDYHPGRGQCEWNCWVRDFDWFCADGKPKKSVNE